jgi:hypothetical protein
MEDNDYKGDLGGYSLYTPSAQGVFNEPIHYDLNEDNVRCCVTPEFPAGAWVYFTSMQADGTPCIPTTSPASFSATPLVTTPASSLKPTTPLIATPLRHSPFRRISPVFFLL